MTAPDPGATGGYEIGLIQMAVGTEPDPEVAITAFRFNVPLRENWERLEDMRPEDGTRLEVIALPMPAPVVFGGQRLPASYANF